jgi:hypothetical protein
MNIQLAIVTLLATLAAGTIGAAPEQQDPPPPPTNKEMKIRKLLDTTGAAATGKQVMDAMLNEFGKTNNLPEGFIEKFKETAKPDTLVEIIVPIYIKHLDEDTIDGAIAFFESPAGKKFLKAQPEILKESMEAGQKWGAESARKTLKALQDDKKKDK